ncbi:MAG: cytochrome b/b6 domain-containing protein [Deltaproteobacteria bacterium]|nr:cytochrome b/b6 domain-containing protein [Deltaproteobacteria bacterium]
MKDNIWDLPTRLFHWSFAAALIVAFAASTREWFLDYHLLAGAAAFALVAFRVVWGFSGNRSARFSGFVRGWADVKGFLSGLMRLNPARYPGHNPAVGWAVIVMLSLTAVLGATGIIVYSGEEMKGPLVGVFSFETAETAGAVHFIAAYSFLALAAIHVAAALLHDIIWKEGLILSMLTGKKTVEGRVEAVAERPLLKKTAFVLFAAVTAGAILLVIPGERQASGHTPALVEGEGGPRAIERNMVYEEECGSCHNAFSPTLLPARSWEKLMAGLGEHFGDDASLPEETTSEISKWLVASSAERAFSEPSKKIISSIGDAAPLRITETTYWKEKHSDIGNEVYSRKAVSSRTNCAACHPGAPSGSFEDRDISVPRG